MFSHLNEKSQDQFLAELSRIIIPGGHLFLTIHGTRALERAKREETIWRMLDIDKPTFDSAFDTFESNKHAFILQHGHLTKLEGSEKRDSKTKKNSLIRKLFKKNDDKEKLHKSDGGKPYEYGIAFIPKDYVLEHWSKWFDVVEVRSGAIHDFQDIVVLKAK